VPIAGVIDTQQGPRAVSGQIDRLVVTPDAVLIIDFKTNRPSPDRIEDVSETYLRQMATYRAALSGIFPNLPVRAILLWTDGPKWMELPDNMLAAHAP
jgi:ATP-dependent helicase/nuclease subunit A